MNPFGILAFLRFDVDGGRMAKKRTGKGKIPPPYPLAMVISDAIWRDPGTGKRTILGCFSVIFAKTFPAAHAMMAVYVAITDGRGKVPIVLKIVTAMDDQEDETVLIEATSEVEFSDPRTVVELDLHFGNLVFPKPGEYRFQLYAANEFLMERRLVVVQLPESQS